MNSTAITIVAIVVVLVAFAIVVTVAIVAERAMVRRERRLNDAWEDTYRTWDKILARQVARNDAREAARGHSVNTNPRPDGPPPVSQAGPTVSGQRSLLCGESQRDSGAVQS